MKVTTPAAEDVAVLPVSVPVPAVIVAVTTTPAMDTGLPAASWSWITGCVVSGAPLPAVVDGAVVNAIWLPGPAVTLIALDTTLFSEPLWKRSVREPGVPVMFRFEKVASPLGLVVAVSVPLSVPLPTAMTAMTLTPAPDTALPLTSATWMMGCCGNVTPTCAADDGCVAMSSCVAVPAVMAIGPNGSGVTEPVVNDRVKLPAVPMIAKPLNVAAPFATVTALLFRTVPVPVVIDAEMTTPAPATGLPEASRNCTTGCVANATPFVADDDGAVVNVICVARPALSAMLPDVTEE